MLLGSVSNPYPNPVQDFFTVGLLVIHISFLGGGAALQ